MAVIWSNGAVGSYTAASNGNLTTTNKSMPGIGVSPLVASISPNNEFLALAGNGVEIFHFNGANPPTQLAHVNLPNCGADCVINSIAWDNNSHLILMSTFIDIWVVTVTSSGVKLASGSPYLEESGYTVTVVPITE
jgi:hypothetical protein